MSREELLELAPLDALGLLDEYEAALYSRSFHHASVAIQDEIRGLQAEIAADSLMLPDEEPDPALRASVLAAVSTAMEREASDLAPIATIGRARGDGDASHGDRLGLSGQFWRAAAFAMAAGLLVSLYFLAQTHSWSNEIARLAVSSATLDRLEESLPGSFADYYGKAQEMYALRPTEADGSAAGMVYVLDETHAFLYVDGLSDHTQEYTVQLVNAEGTHVLGVLEGGGDLPSLEIRDEAMLGGFNGATAMLQIIDSAGTVILTTA